MNHHLPPVDISAAPSNLSLTALKALIVLATQPITQMTILSDTLGISSAAMTQLADSYVHLFQRQRNPRDRRAITLTLTDDGRVLADRLLSVPD